MNQTLIISVLVLTAWMFSSAAQDNGLLQSCCSKRISSNQAGAAKGASGGQHQLPSPSQMAKRLMSKFDANKDGELSQDELTQALEALIARHRQNGGQGGGSGGASQSGKGAHRQGISGNGSQQSVGQGGQGGQHHERPPADKIAGKIIEKFSSDKKGVTEAELTKAIEEHRAKRAQRQQGAGLQGAGHGGQHGGAAL